MPRSLPLRRKLLYALVPLLVLLVVVEAGSALLGRYLLHTRKPDLPVVDKAERPARSRVEVQSAPLMVLCLGDSWTFGHGLPVNQAYPAQLQDRLAREHDIESFVVNLGQPGANPLRMARILKNFLVEHPGHDFDLVVYQGGANGDPAEVAEIEGPGAPLWNSLRPVLRHLAAYRLLEQVTIRARLRTDALLHNLEYQTARPSMARNLEVREATLRANLGRAHELALAYDLEMVVLTYGYPAFLAENEWLYHPTMNQMIREAAARRGLPLIDMEALYAERELGPELLLHGSDRLEPEDLDLHPNPEGYAVYAERVAEWIAAHREQLLP